MISPAADAALIEGLVRCEECDEHFGVVGLLPLEYRSLRNLENSMRQMSDPEQFVQRCARCGEQLTVSELFYSFEEEDTEPVRWDFDAGCMTIMGAEVESEEQLVELLGRPFSTADLHRMALGGGTRPAIYQSCVGAITAALPLSEITDEEELDAAHSEQMRVTTELFAQAGTEKSDLVTMPLPWAALPGCFTWIGDPGAEIRSGRLSAMSVFEVNRAIDEIARAGERLSLEVDTSDWREEMKVRLRYGDFVVEVSPLHVFTETIERAFTVAEAASWVVGRYEPDLKCAGEVLEQLRQRGHEVDMKHKDGMVSVKSLDSDSAAMEVNLLSLSRKAGRKAEEVVSWISNELGRILHDGAGPPPLGKERHCGCLPSLTYVLRERPWVEETAAKTLLYEPVQTTEGSIEIGELFNYNGVDVCKVVAEDCPHGVSFIVSGQAEASQMTVEEVFRAADKGLEQTEFTVYAEAICDFDDRVCGVAYLGYNLASVLLSDELVRGLDRQWPRVDEGPDELLALAFTKDLVYLLDPEADPELIGLHLIDLRQRMATTQWSESSFNLQRVVEREGPEAGRFTCSSTQPEDKPTPGGADRLACIGGLLPYLLQGMGLL